MKTRKMVQCVDGEMSLVGWRGLASFAMFLLIVAALMLFPGCGGGDNPPIFTDDGVCVSNCGADNGQKEDGSDVDGNTDAPDTGTVCYNDSDCDDGVACTVDSCFMGKCANVADNKLCGTGTCNAKKGCVDAKSCFSVDQCSDNYNCTVEGCNAQTHLCEKIYDDTRCDGEGRICLGENAPSGSYGCVKAKRCTGDGDCKPADTDADPDAYPWEKPCAVGKCVAGVCTYAGDDSQCGETGMACYKYACQLTMTYADYPIADWVTACYEQGTPEDFCLMWSCETVPAIDCDDGDACTEDSCDSEKGCMHTPDSCNDYDECTTDSCDNEKGCVNTPDDCDDGVNCTDDYCSAAGCEHNPDFSYCDDDNLCTTDSCDSEKGCVNTPLDCDDDNLCTTDSCDSEKGCVNTFSCDDGDACTEDSCDDVGGCVNTWNGNCHDGDPCTADTCDKVKGCVNTWICP